MSEFAHRFVNTNGIRMHFVEEGSGLVVILAAAFRSHDTPDAIKFRRSQSGLPRGGACDYEASLSSLPAAVMPSLPTFR